MSLSWMIVRHSTLPQDARQMCGCGERRQTVSRFNDFNGRPSCEGLRAIQCVIWTTVLSTLVAMMQNDANSRLTICFRQQSPASILRSHPGFNPLYSPLRWTWILTSEGKLWAPSLVQNPTQSCSKLSQSAVFRVELRAIHLLLSCWGRRIRKRIKYFDLTAASKSLISKCGSARKASYPTLQRVWIFNLTFVGLGHSRELRVQMGQVQVR